MRAAWQSLSCPHRFIGSKRHIRIDHTVIPLSLDSIPLPISIHIPGKLRNSSDHTAIIFCTSTPCGTVSTTIAPQPLSYHAHSSHHCMRVMTCPSSQEEVGGTIGLCMNCVRRVGVSLGMVGSSMEQESQRQVNSYRMVAWGGHHARGNLSPSFLY